MFTKYPINLEIKNPCEEDFSIMHTTAKGKFCNSCQKEVIDFTTFTNADLVKWFENNTSKTCGRLTHIQLETFKREVVIKHRFLPRLFLGIMVGLGIITKAEANGKINAVKTSIEYKNTNNITINNKQLAIKETGDLKVELIDYKSEKPIKYCKYFITNDNKIIQQGVSDKYGFITIKKDTSKINVFAELYCEGYAYSSINLIKNFESVHLEKQYSFYKDTTLKTNVLKFIDFETKEPLKNKEVVFYINDFDFEIISYKTDSSGCVKFDDLFIQQQINDIVKIDFKGYLYNISIFNQGKLNNGIVSIIKKDEDFHTMGMISY